MVQDKIRKPLEVEPIQDHLLRFHVYSEKEPNNHHPYRVDLAANNKLGKCDCAHFSARIQSRINRGDSVPVSARCKHIESARNYLCDELIRRIASMNESRGV